MAPEIWLTYNVRGRWWAISHLDVLIQISLLAGYNVSFHLTYQLK